MTRAQALFGMDAAVTEGIGDRMVTVYAPSSVFAGVSILGKFGPFESKEETLAYAQFLRGIATPSHYTDGAWHRAFHANLTKMDGPVLVCPDDPSLRA